MGISAVSDEHQELLIHPHRVWSEIAIDVVLLHEVKLSSFYSSFSTGALNYDQIVFLVHHVAASVSKNDSDDSLFIRQQDLLKQALTTMAVIDCL